MRFLLISLLCALAVTAQADPPARIRVLVQSSPLAGYRHYEAPALWSQLQVGDALTLQREPDNPHDANAIRVEWQGQKLGYLPRAENQSLAAEMDKGTRLAARIAALKKGRSAWQRVRVDVFVVM
ncbi:MAG: hypothetical protein RIR70_1794 [Pseudomonadota bacterium]|jgi:hypothetical protein